MYTVVQSLYHCQDDTHHVTAHSITPPLDTEKVRHTKPTPSSLNLEFCATDPEFPCIENVRRNCVNPRIKKNMLNEICINGTLRDDACMIFESE